jgi:pimeloyl-ACP methyl ester carboxylesterase
MWLQQRRFDYSLTERRLGHLRVPTLVVWGDADRFDRPWQARELGRCIPDATVRILPGCGRSVQEDCPVPADHALSSFLTGRSCP